MLQLKLIGILVLLCGLCSQAAISETSVADKSCDESCSFVLLSEADGKFHFSNRQRAEQRFTPYSTFKVVNTLIALEEGLITGPSHTLKLNQNRYPVEKWWPQSWYQTPLSIREAFHASALPLYRQLALDVGKDSMSARLQGLHYGNGDISSGLDSFWLNGSLQISAVEQLCFLRRLARHELPLKDETFTIFNRVMEVDLEKESKSFANAIRTFGPDVKLFAKTGGGPIRKGRYIGWYVGYLQSAKSNYYFALNMEANSFKALQGARKTMLISQLRGIGLL
ncbi:penicillin-binding transpeptidase domain-containing protein [uncultured Pseudoteredinibacter sp.]|uniref:penicillin-binding transpeptidase domain-containing protein n=1 Tax=uncultured Pseudoteredinibacter sp. TaxID=1641701 RepID=UPI00263740EC|nr:penicillin-binding transpeptidase domain-containing protein [uncultured Pseudoteredinibacter sp.]